MSAFFADSPGDEGGLVNPQGGISPEAFKAVMRGDDGNPVSAALPDLLKKYPDSKDLPEHLQSVTVQFTGGTLTIPRDVLLKTPEVWRILGIYASGQELSDEQGGRMSLERVVQAFFTFTQTADGQFVAKIRETEALDEKPELSSAERIKRDILSYCKSRGFSSGTTGDIMKDRNLCRLIYRYQNVPLKGEPGEDKDPEIVVGELGEGKYPLSELANEINFQILGVLEGYAKRAQQLAEMAVHEPDTAKRKEMVTVALDNFQIIAEDLKKVLDDVPKSYSGEWSSFIEDFIAKLADQYRAIEQSQDTYLRPREETLKAWEDLLKKQEDLLGKEEDRLKERADFLNKQGAHTSVVLLIGMGASLIAVLSGIRAYFKSRKGKSG